jgi:ribosome biogenesis protein Nip4
MEEMRNLYSVCRKTEGKSPLVRPRGKWDDNVRMYLREIGREVVNWMHLTQVRYLWRAVVNTVMKFQVP